MNSRPNVSLLAVMVVCASALGQRQAGTNSIVTPDPCASFRDPSSQEDPLAGSEESGKSQTGVQVIVSPRTNTRVAVGYSVRLAATVTGATDKTIEWTVTGRGCSGSACGLIDGGVYLAPTFVPNPPIVRVTATSKADPKGSDSTAVCIVPHGPQWNLLSATGGIRTAEIVSTRGATRASSGNSSIDGLEVTTDTQGVDFGPYLQRVVGDIRQHWYAIIPESAMPPVRKRGKVVIEFAIDKDGQIGALRYAANSGDVALDRAAYGGITASNPFLPLPTEFHGLYLGLRFIFFYNPSLTAIVPSRAQVRAGFSLQFSPVLRETAQATDSAITWSVGGRGCTGSECGTISGAGLYTAPIAVPTNAKIKVEATAGGDLGETASAVVTILPPEPSQSTSGQH